MLYAPAKTVAPRAGPCADPRVDWDLGSDQVGFGLWVGLGSGFGPEIRGWV